MKAPAHAAEAFLQTRLKELRDKSGLTQEQYAEQAKFSYKYYQGIERGQWTNLRLRTIEKLAAGYGLTISELFAPNLPNRRSRPGKSNCRIWRSIDNLLDREYPPEIETPTF